VAKASPGQTALGEVMQPTHTWDWWVTQGHVSDVPTERHTIATGLRGVHPEPVYVTREFVEYRFREMFASVERLADLDAGEVIEGYAAHYWKVKT
jgi:hypothetical protein